MKTSEEMTRDVLARIHDTKEKQARRRKAARTILGAGGVLCLAALAVFGLPELLRPRPETARQELVSTAAAETEEQTQAKSAKSQVSAPADEPQTEAEPPRSAEPGTETAVTTAPAGENSPGFTMAFLPEARTGEPPEPQTIPYLIRDGGGNGGVKYRGPLPGQHVITVPLSEAVAAHKGDENAYYLLRFEVVNDALSGMTAKEQESFYLAEAKRMDALDPEDKIDFIVETSKDENTGETRVVFAGLLRDPSFLEEFPDHPDYGYFIALHDETSGVK